MSGVPFHLLTASIIAGIIGISSFLLGPAIIGPAVAISIEPDHGLIVTDELFTIDLLVKADIPVNVFRGLITFDNNILEVSSISYNTSIADLWAEEPWYSNGDGTISFIGGTTAPGGFIGKGSLITVTFKAKRPGDARIALSEVQVLKHDGFGSDAEVQKPIDSVFAVANETLKEKTVYQANQAGPKVSVVSTPPNTDLNGDGKQTIADISIFMADLVTKNLRSDFNQDSEVNLKDLSILNQVR